MEQPKKRKTVDEHILNILTRYKDNLSVEVLSLLNTICLQSQGKRGGEGVIGKMIHFETVVSS